MHWGRASTCRHGRLLKGEDGAFSGHSTLPSTYGRLFLATNEIPRGDGDFLRAMEEFSRGNDIFPLRLLTVRAGAGRACRWGRLAVGCNHAPSWVPDQSSMTALGLWFVRASETRRA